MDKRKTQTIGSTDYVSVYTYAFANPDQRDKYEYMLSAEMDYNSRIKEAEDRSLAKGIMQEKARGIRIYIKMLNSIGIDHSQILSMIKEDYNLTTAEADRYIEQVIKEISENSGTSESNPTPQP